jgi:hypothetical protein
VSRSIGVCKTERMYDLANLFHIGILTPDINESMQELSRTMGVSWASMIDEMRLSWVPGTGRVEIPCKITYSVEGPVHLELIEGGAGSIWDGVASPGAHHFGVWSEDLGSSWPPAGPGLRNVCLHAFTAGLPCRTGASDCEAALRTLVGGRRVARPCAAKLTAHRVFVR